MLLPVGINPFTTSKYAIVLKSTNWLAREYLGCSDGDVCVA